MSKTKKKMAERSNGMEEKCAPYKGRIFQDVQVSTFFTVPVHTKGKVNPQTNQSRLQYLLTGAVCASADEG